MTRNILTSRPFRQGFERGFVSILGIHGRSPLGEPIDMERGSVSTAWRDVGTAVREAMGEVEIQDGQGSRKKYRLRKAS